MRFVRRDERPVSAVPRAVKAVLVAALAAQVAWQAAAPKPVAAAAALGMPPPAQWLEVASVGEPIGLSELLVLYLQAFDNQPGVSVPFRDLDYGAVEAWLGRALDLDPAGQYPLLMASHLYTQVPDEAKRRRMLEFVHREFLRDPNRRWRWLAHAALIAKHQLRDMPLALRYADDIARHAPAASGWAKQMRIFIREDMGELESATVLLGGLLAGGEVTDAAEIRFLTERLEKMKSAEKSSAPSKSR
ncbi:MAG TPA: hypothetical protein VHP37_05130 [Burkholderiales bacterium]|nr:hypothetical protein [Burkholderiales bacterium]